MKMLPAVTLIVILAACAAPADDTEMSGGEMGETMDTPAEFTAADEAAIRELIAEWDRTFSAGDFEAVVALYTDDYVEAVGPETVGPEAALARYQGFTNTYTSSASTVRRIEGQGDLAYVWSQTEFHLTNADGEPRIQRGNNVSVLRRDAEGEWHIAASGFGTVTSVPDSTGN